MLKKIFKILTTKLNSFLFFFIILFRKKYLFNLKTKTMAVKFNVIERGNPLKPNDPKKFYASSNADGEITLKALSKRISSMSTVNSGDVLAVLDLLIQVCSEELASGKIVRLGDFGSFQVTISSEGQATADKVNANSVKGAKLQFRPGKELKNMLTTLEFEKA
jgi:predicted histone-like DNA-binding protein